MIPDQIVAVWDQYVVGSKDDDDAYEIPYLGMCQDASGRGGRCCQDRIIS